MELKRADGWCGMDIRPVSEVYVVSTAGVRRVEGDVLPALAVEGAEQTEDSYGGEAGQQDRGMEEEEATTQEDGEKSEVISDGGQKRLDIFA